VKEWNRRCAIGVQGLLLMAMAPDVPGAARPKSYYEGKLREVAGYWSACSNDGQAGMGSWTFCKCAFLSQHACDHHCRPALKC
jgi:hypothetical protein